MNNIHEPPLQLTCLRTWRQLLDMHESWKAVGDSTDSAGLAGHTLAHACLGCMQSALHCCYGIQLRKRSSKVAPKPVKCVLAVPGHTLVLSLLLEELA